MESNQELLEYLDTQRWLLNQGLYSDIMKNQLFLYGTLAHSETEAVELSISHENKTVNYTIYLPTSVIRKINKYYKLSEKCSNNPNFFNLWRFKRFLQKEGDLNLQNILQDFISDYCGPGWVAKVTVRDFIKYSDEDFEEKYQDQSEENKNNSEDEES